VKTLTPVRERDFPSTLDLRKVPPGYRSR
jgi:hypothetical protein